MADIFHQIRMSIPPAEVFHAVTTQEWAGDLWTKQMPTSLLMVEMERGTRVAWQCTQGPHEWIGTMISFELLEEGGETIVMFSHTNWREPTMFLADCTTRWGRFLFALKAYLETPEPDDLHS